MQAHDIICRRLRRMEIEEDVVVVHASCIGSRLWGYDSPTSDYDVQFVYVRPISAYLTAGDTPKQTMRFREIVDGIDVDAFGQDAGRVLNLLFRGNVVLSESIFSRIFYDVHPESFGRTQLLLSLLASDPSWNRNRVHHHLSWASKVIGTDIATGEPEDGVYPEHYIHAVRHLLLAEHLINTDEVYTKPLPSLIAEILGHNLSYDSFMPTNCCAVFLDLLLTKQNSTGESRRRPGIPIIDEFLEYALSELTENVKAMTKPGAVSQTEIDAAFHTVLGDVWDSWRPNAL